MEASSPSFALAQWRPVRDSLSARGGIMTPQQISQLYMANICLDGLWLIPSPTVADGLLQAFDGEEVKDLPPEIRDLIVSAQWSEDEIEDLFAGEGSSATE